MRKKILMQLCILIAAISLVVVFGAIGGLENGLMSFWTSLVVGFVSLTTFYIFTQLAIVLDYGIKKEHHRRPSVSVQANYYITNKVTQEGRNVNV